MSPSNAKREIGNQIHRLSTKRIYVVQKLFTINFFRAQSQYLQELLIGGKEII
jgi:hypothetical protein